MWRRRLILPFRRLLMRRARVGMPLVDPKLIEANRLFENSNYVEAAAIYADLAENALNKNIPQSLHLFLLAGIARMKAGEIQNAIELFKRGLEIIIERKKWGHLHRASENIIERMKNNGFTKQAVELQSWLDAQIPNDVRALPNWNEKTGDYSHRKDLPTHCPACGGPVNPKELEWIGSNTNCNYCGTLLTGD
jgi:hypothetical protein